MDKKEFISHYQPFLLRPTKEFQEIAATEQEEVVSLKQAVQTVFDNQYLDSLTAYGCKKWEKMLNIVPKQTDTIPVRKMRIKARLNERLPYTYRMLLSNLDTLCGKGKYQVRLNANEYEIEIRLELPIKKLYKEVEALIKRILPANLVLGVKLRYHCWNEIQYMTWNQVIPFTWRQIREEQTPSYCTYQSLEGIANKEHAKKSHSMLSGKNNYLQEYKGLVSVCHNGLSSYTNEKITNKNAAANVENREKGEKNE